MTKNKKIKILLTGGGTVGHIKPIFLVKDELKNLSKEQNIKIDFLYIGSKGGPEKELAQKEKIKFKEIYCGKFRRYFSLQNFIDPFRILAGFFQAFFILLFNRPKIVFAKGGYATVPVIWAASILLVPIVAHESDMIMGLANKIALKHAKKMCVGFPIKYYKNILKDKLVYTGNPVEKVISDKEKAVSNKPTILIMGGSQGARFINQTVAAIMPDLTKKYNVIHVSGKVDYEWLDKNNWENYKLYNFTNKIPQFIDQAKLIISRAGASSLAEISNAGKPAILIPLASSANDHQTKNAKFYAKANAALMLTEDKLTPDGLKESIDLIFKDSELRKLMSLATKNLVKPNAAKSIAEVILSVIKLPTQSKDSYEKE